MLFEVCLLCNVQITGEISLKENSNGFSKKIKKNPAWCNIFCVLVWIVDPRPPSFSNTTFNWFQPDKAFISQFQV